MKVIGIWGSVVFEGNMEAKTENNCDVTEAMK